VADDLTGKIVAFGRAADDLSGGPHVPSRAFVPPGPVEAATRLAQHRHDAARAIYGA
jgi:hypothetical protein